MSCRRVSRELLERFRFGEELDARSGPHLDHLEGCLACRQEVGLDRALVTQLRRALQARVDGYAPSPSAWQLVRQRALTEPAPSLGRLSWLARLPAGLRAGGAVAAVALVLMLGLPEAGGEDQVTDFRLRAAGRGQMARANALPGDPPPYATPRAFYPPSPLPPPAAGRYSVIMSYTPTGEAVATTRPNPRLVSGLLR